jgi:hypothetical protein
MRQHGIDLPDPQFSGDNIVQRLPTRAEQNSPKCKAAQQACRQYLPNGGQPSPPTAQERQQAVAFARCMRQHGIDLPDLKITADGIDQQGATGVDRDDPRLKAAERACHQYGALPPVKSGGPQSGGAASEHAGGPTREPSPDVRRDRAGGRPLWLIVDGRSTWTSVGPTRPNVGRAGRPKQSRASSRVRRAGGPHIEGRSALPARHAEWPNVSDGARRASP